MPFATKIAAFSAALLVMVLAHAGPAPAQTPMPTPVLVLQGQEPFQLFAASPNLPPCGLNTSASRTWVDFFDKAGKRLNGFCALGSHNDLNGIWFALEPNVIPPSYVHIEMTDRQTNTKVKSNDADTTL